MRDQKTLATPRPDVLALSLARCETAEVSTLKNQYMHSESALTGHALITGPRPDVTALSPSLARYDTSVCTLSRHTHA